MSWTRVRPPGVRPLEIWDRPFRGGQLWQHLGAGAPREGLAGALAEIVEELRPLGFDEVWVTGGLTLVPGLRDALPGGRDAVRWCPDAPFGAELGGRALLPGATVVDVGQTAIKVCGATRSVHPRPALDGRDALVAWVAAAVPACGPVVLALPCGIDDSGALGPCTYAGLDAAFLDDVLALAGRAGDPAPDRRGDPTLVLNDAELAAVSARERLGDVRALVLTLGFGPGAALLEGS